MELVWPAGGEGWRVGLRAVAEEARRRGAALAVFASRRERAVSAAPSSEWEGRGGPGPVFLWEDEMAVYNAHLFPPSALERAVEAFLREGAGGAIAVLVWEVEGVLVFVERRRAEGEKG
jgi:NAD(P)-dependent dehydrogenase (short-subunit alcohol dehydrogenase family)